MRLLSFFQRKAADRAASEPLSVDEARLRARRRLIGALVLVSVAVVGFPLLFDTSPRPLPLDIPVTVSGSDLPAFAPVNAASDAAAARQASSGEDVAAERPAEVERAPAAAATGAAAASADGVARAPELEPTPPAPARKPAPAAAPPKPDAEAARALAALQDKPEAAPKPGEADTRFVVQVGAFSEAASARQVRQRVEKLGLKTYTQVVDTASGKRIRVRIGPYRDRDEADRAAARLKRAGLQPAVLTL